MRLGLCSGTELRSTATLALYLKERLGVPRIRQDRPAFVAGFPLAVFAEIRCRLEHLDCISQVFGHECVLARLSQQALVLDSQCD